MDADFSGTALVFVLVSQSGTGARFKAVGGARSGYYDVWCGHRPSTAQYSAARNLCNRDRQAFAWFSDGVLICSGLPLCSVRIL